MSSIPLGATRFNSDSQKLEYWNGSVWMQIKTETASLYGGEVFFTAGGANKLTQTFNIVTGGTAVDTGLSQLVGIHSPAAVNSKTRGVTMGGRANSSPYPQSNVIQFFEFATKGNYADFGDLTEAREAESSLAGKKPRSKKKKKGNRVVVGRRKSELFSPKGTGEVSASSDQSSDVDNSNLIHVGGNYMGRPDYSESMDSLVDVMNRLYPVPDWKLMEDTQSSFYIFRTDTCSCWRRV